MVLSAGKKFSSAVVLSVKPPDGEANIDPFWARAISPVGASSRLTVAKLDELD